MSTAGAGHVVERVSDCLNRAISNDRLVGGVVLVALERETVVDMAAGLADREAGPIRLARPECQNESW